MYKRLYIWLALVSARFETYSMAFRKTATAKRIPSTGHDSQPPTESRAKCIQTVESDDAQGDRDRLLQADSSRDRGTAEDNGSEEPELDAIRLVVLDTVAAKGICMDVS